MKLGILKTDTVRPEWVPQFGEYPDMFVALLSKVDPDIEFVTYDVEDGHYPGHIDEVDAYLITGSKSSVYDDKPWIPPLIEFVREIAAAGKKIVGICFGHQLIAHALGGKTGKSPKGWGSGVHTHTFIDFPEWHDGGDADLNILVSHQDQVVENATGAKVLASSDFCEHAVCQIDDQILTFQGHPEFIPAYSKEIMELRRELFGEEVYHSAVASLSSETQPQGDRVAQWIVNFLRAA